jgi:hypothetical protein
MCGDSNDAHNNMDESHHNSQDSHFLDIVKARKLPYGIVYAEDNIVIFDYHAKIMHSILSSPTSTRDDTPKISGMVITYHTARLNTSMSTNTSNSQINDNNNLLLLLCGQLNVPRVVCFYSYMEG